MTIRKVIWYEEIEMVGKIPSRRQSFLLIGTLSNRLWAAPGDLDPSFDTGSGINGAVRAVVVESDGKFAVTAPTPVLQADVRRELAEVDPYGRFVR